MREQAAHLAAPGRGGVRMLTGDRRGPELAFEFPFDEELNAAVKRLPGRWFNWRHRQWRVPADPRVAKHVERVLARFPGLEPAPEVLAWLGDSDRWRALVTVAPYEGAGAFVMRTLSGEAPTDLGGIVAADGRLLLPFSGASAELLSRLEGAQLDDRARACARELRLGEHRRRQS